MKPVGGKYEGVWTHELKNGDISYYINYRDGDGKPTRLKVGKKTARTEFTVRDAYSKLIEIKYKIQNNEAPTLKVSRASKIKFQDIWDKYLEWAKNNKKTWRDDEIRYNKHLAPRFASKPVQTLKSLDFENMKNELLKSELSASSVKHILAVARQVFNHAIKDEIIKNFVNPIAAGRVKLPEIDNARLAYLTKQQARELLEILLNTDTTTHYLTAFLLHTGARFSEISNLSWQDLNLKNRTIYFKKNKRGNSRHVYINDQLLKIVQELKKKNKSHLVIPNQINEPYRVMPKHFQNAISKLFPDNQAQQAKHKITPHSLRHTHASWLAETGLDILQIKEQLGHKTIEMTMRYAHLIPNKRHEATQTISI